MGDSHKWVVIEGEKEKKENSANTTTSSIGEWMKANLLLYRPRQTCWQSTNDILGKEERYASILLFLVFTFLNKYYYKNNDGSSNNKSEFGATTNSSNRKTKRNQTDIWVFDSVKSKTVKNFLWERKTTQTHTLTSKYACSKRWFAHPFTQIIFTFCNRTKPINADLHVSSTGESGMKGTWNGNKHF